MTSDRVVVDGVGKPLHQQGVRRTSSGGLRLTTVLYGGAILGSSGWALVALVRGNVQLALCICLTTLWTVWLVKRTLGLLRTQNVVGIAGECVPLGILLTYLGVGSIACIAGTSDVFDYEGTFGANAALSVACLGFLASVCYSATFRTALRRLPSRTEGPEPVSEGGTLLLTLILVVASWFGRIEQIRLGLFFTWVRDLEALTREHYHESAFTHIRGLVEYLVPTLLVYLIRKKRGAIYKTLLFIDGAFVFLEGSRGAMTYFAIAVGLAYVVMYRPAKSFRMLTIIAGGAVVFLGVIAPAVQRARKEMQVDSDSLLANPATVPFVFVSEYLPAALGQGLAGRVEPDDRLQGVSGRVGSYASYAAVIVQKVEDGHSVIGVGGALDELLIVIPRAFYPDKLSTDSVQVVFHHYGFGIEGGDAGGTPLADAFAYLNVPGVVILFVFGGGAFAALFRHLVIKFGDVGRIVVCGVFPATVPEGHSFAYYLANIRNVALLLIALTVFFFVVRILSQGWSKRVRRSRVSAVTSRSGEPS